MSDGFGGNVREGPPVAVCRFRHRDTGDEAVLSVRIYWPCGQERYLVKVARPDDRTNVPGIMHATDPGFRERAREVRAGTPARAAAGRL